MGAARQEHYRPEPQPQTMCEKEASTNTLKPPLKITTFNRIAATRSSIEVNWRPLLLLPCSNRWASAAWPADTLHFSSGPVSQAKGSQVPLSSEPAFSQGCPMSLRLTHLQDIISKCFGPKFQGLTEPVLVGCLKLLKLLVGQGYFKFRLLKGWRGSSTSEQKA